MGLTTWVQGLYVLTSIFGIGVTLIDMLGILGGDEGEGDADLDLGDADADVGGDLSLDDVDIDADGDADADLSVEAGDGEIAGPEAEAGNVLTNAGAGNASHDPVFATSFIILKYLRRIVYFSLGFGPVGLMAMGTGSSLLGSLAWAIPSGLLSSFLAGWILGFQRSDVDSSVTGRDLFYQRAQVLVPISPGGMGKVRATVGQSVVDRFARAENTQDSFAKGEDVYITRVTKDCVYVEAIVGEVSGASPE